MQRITGGLLRGRKLLALPGGVTSLRPTGARVREAIFNRLQGEVSGARVLDLFAGSGALAIEALSRGAEAAVLVERERVIVQHLRRQLAAVGLETRARVIARDARELVRGAPEGGPFELAFLDPPYATARAETAALLEALAASGWLARDALVIFEYERAGAGAGFVAGGYTNEASRRYGQTAVDYLRWSGLGDAS